MLTKTKQGYYKIGKPIYEETAKKMKESYNGYSNYETWNVNLWYDSDEGLYSTKLDLIKQARGNVRKLANLIESNVEFWFQENNSFGDLDSIRKISKVNWLEIARFWAEEGY